MAIPAILGAIMLGGLAISAASNLYQQHNQRDVYENEERANRNLYGGYQNYLSRQGRTVNPNKSWNSYFGSAEKARVNLANSRAASVGTFAGGIGAGAGTFGKTNWSSLYDSSVSSKLYGRL